MSRRNVITLTIVAVIFLVTAVVWFVRRNPQGQLAPATSTTPPPAAPAPKQLEYPSVPASCKDAVVYDSLAKARAVSPEKVCRLKLFEQGLTEVPADVWKYTNLIELNLAGNKLASISPQIGVLKSLQVLYLGSNKLEAVPPEVGALQNLVLLSLYANQLKGLPQEVQNLKSLQRLGLTGNALSQEEKDKIRGLLPGVTIDF
jgi:hypothetical protein